MALPDIVSDPVVKAAKIMGCQFVESFFYRVALESGWRDQPGRRDAEMEARDLMNIWARQGFNALPKFVREFAQARVHGNVKQLFSNAPIKEKR